VDEHAIMGIPVRVSPYVRAGEMIWFHKGTPRQFVTVRSLPDLRVALYRANFWARMMPRLRALEDAAASAWRRA
jgi:hypothetical protein